MEECVLVTKSIKKLEKNNRKQVICEPDQGLVIFPRNLKNWRYVSKGLKN